MKMALSEGIEMRFRITYTNCPTVCHMSIPYLDHRRAVEEHALGVRTSMRRGA